MSVFLQEQGSIVIFDEWADIVAATPTASPYIEAAKCDLVELITLFGINGTTLAADQCVLEVLAASDSSGTGAVVVSIRDLFYTVGAPKIEDGTGVPTRVKYDNSPAASWTTPLANGDTQVQVVIPVRSRQLPVDKTWLAARVTPGSNNRHATHMAIRCNSQFGHDEAVTLL